MVISELVPLDLGGRVGLLNDGKFAQESVHHCSLSLLKGVPGITMIGVWTNCHVWKMGCSVTQYVELHMPTFPKALPFQFRRTGSSHTG